MTVTEMNAHDERISSFLDDAMPAAERSTFESELLDNAELRQQVIELRQLRQDVATLPRFSVTEGFAQRVVAAAVAAKANENANITPAAQPKPKTVRRVAIGGLAIAASVAILFGTLAWINNKGPVDVAKNGNNVPVVEQPASSPLAPVLASLPADDQVLVVRITSPKSLAAGNVLREALAEQGIEKRRPSDQTTGGGLVRKAYKDRIDATTSGDATKTTAAADALYVQISPEELELALARLAEPGSAVKFVPEQHLAVGKGFGNTKTQAAGELTSENQANAAEPTKKADFIQDLTPGLFKMPKEGTPEITPHPAPSATPKGKVRVLILIENVE